MKAEFSNIAGSSIVAQFVPENDDDVVVLRELGTRLKSTHIIISRGFNYMESGVQFVIQQYPSND